MGDTHSLSPGNRRPSYSGAALLSMFALLSLSACTPLRYAPESGATVARATITADQTTVSPVTTTAPAIQPTSVFTVPTNMPVATGTQISDPMNVSVPTEMQLSPAVTFTPPSPTPIGTPPTVYTFAASPTQIDPGGPVTLTWTVSAERVAICQADERGRGTLPCYEGGPSGSVTLNAPPLQRNRLDFLLYAITGSQSDLARASVMIRCPDVWFFANPPAECPTPAIETTFTAQDFERGRMLWAKSTDRIYILYAGGLRWEVVQNGWVEGMPESDPAIVPPDGRYQPIRGFGMTWRDEQKPAGYGERVQERLGWASHQEYWWGDGAVQCDAISYSTCYIGGPDGLLYVLKPEHSGWFIWDGSTPVP